MDSVTRTLVAALDAEGQSISDALRSELPDAKVEYFSAALTRKLPA